MDIILPILIVAVIAAVCGAALAVVSHIFSVPKDEREEKIREALPGANCGSCGYSGCDGYAAAIAAGEAEPDLCSPGGAATASALSEILGVAVDVNEKAAFVGCRGQNGICNPKFDYQGMRSCAAAAALLGGPGACPSSCIGFGDCAAVCSHDAIRICEGVAVVDSGLCGGCGNCAAVCPKKLIRIAPRRPAAHVFCSNTEKGGIARKNCSAACIGCKKCEKSCAESAIRVENNLAVVDSSACTGCGNCVEACPQKCILLF